MRSPGFEPGSSAWEADVLAKLDYDRLNQGLNLGVLGHVFDFDLIDHSQIYPMTEEFLDQVIKFSMPLGQLSCSK